jgi:hypothetical protein
MPNVLDSEPLRAFARRAALKIEDEKVRARFERLAFEQLLTDVRNFRPANSAEIEAGPDWARRAALSGQALAVFQLNRSASAHLHLLARRLATTCKLAAADASKRRHQQHMIGAARAFIGKIERANFDVTADKARLFAGAWSDLDADGDFDLLCEARAVPSSCGRTWFRVTSVAELHSVGREFRNCIAHMATENTYSHGLRCGLRQFWVLRDRDGVGLVLAMADAPLATQFLEVQGPRNSSIRAYRLDLARLSAAIGLRPSDPPSSPAGAAARRPPPCRCQRCRPRAAPLPLSAAAP